MSVGRVMLCCNYLQIIIYNNYIYIYLEFISSKSLIVNSDNLFYRLTKPWKPRNPFRKILRNF